MITDTTAVKAYNFNKAQGYDDESEHDKGNRVMHLQFLEDILQYLTFKPSRFLDLGCGTGFFSKVFYKVFPDIQGVLIDGSQEMLDVARNKLSTQPINASYHHSVFEDLEWQDLNGDFNIIFSALAIHHLSDHNKWQLFQDIHKNLSHDGVFILYDIFKPQSEFSFRLLEYLACKDCNRRLKEEIGMELEEFKLENIIENDRKIKKHEGDQETALELQIEKLSKIGFKNITKVFQEARFAGLVAFKNF